MKTSRCRSFSTSNDETCLSKRQALRRVLPQLETLEDRVVLSSADLALPLTGPSTANAGSTTYNVTVTNNGPDAASSPSWSDTLGSGLPLVGQVCHGR
jgi:uncharacterized repeat protein (TIGR01451 family)